MPKPQSPELRRSGKTVALNPDAVAGRVHASDEPDRSGPTGPVPEDNRPGHHPDKEQSKPDLDDFVEKFNRAGHEEDPSSGHLAPEDEAEHVDSGVLGVVADPQEAISVGGRALESVRSRAAGLLGVGLERLSRAADRAARRLRGRS